MARQNLLRFFRKRKGLTQTALAGEMGISVQLVFDVERGVRPPWPKFRRNAARILGVSEADLFPGEFYTPDGLTRRRVPHMRGAADERRLLLRVDEAARLCGFSRSHAYELIASGAWPVVRAGKSVRVPRAWLERWIHSQVEEWERAHGHNG